MKLATILSAFLVLTVLDAHCQTIAEPKELIDLRGSFEKARSAALTPLEKKYVEALGGLKDRLTKKADLNGALAVQAEITKFTVSPPDDAKLRLSKFNEVDEFTAWLSTTTWKTSNGELFKFPGGTKMELTRKDGTLVTYPLTVEKIGSVFWTYSTGGKAQMTIAPSLKEASATHSGTLTRIDPK